MSAQKELRADSAGGAAASPMLRACLFLIGFTAVIAQIVLMRELIVVFYGNEISLGLMLATWLLWTALGSSLLGRLARRAHQPRKLMAGLQALIAAALPLTIVAVRASKSAFQPIPGEILGPGPMFLTSLVALSIFCLISGCLFAAGSRLYADEVGASSAAATGSVYLLEAVGSGVGGILASLVLIRYLNAFEIASLLALLNLVAATSLTFRTGLYLRTILAGLLTIFVLLVFPLGNRWLDATSLAHLWRGFRLVTTCNSVYGNLAVVETEGSRSLYENGLVVFTTPDPAAAEEAVHFALLQHPSPRSLLLIGGGVGGGLAQALQHPSLERVDYVELDPATLDLAARHFPQDWIRARADPRVRVHNTDGRLFLKTTDSRFTIIIVNLPDPQTAQLNRFYTQEFYREAAEKLEPGGILSFQVTGAENYISPELADFLRCLNKTLHAVFPEVTAIPGATVHFFAATRPRILASGPEALLTRLRARELQTNYVREYYLPFRMMPDRMLDLESQIRPLSDTAINRDFAPIAYYFDVALWSARFHRGYRRWFKSLATLDFSTAAGGIAFLLLSSAAFAYWRLQSPTTGDYRLGVRAAVAHRHRVVAGFCVAAMGFTLISLQILLLLGFQAIYGYVYHQLAILIAAFMVGLAGGSWRALRRAGDGEGASARPSAESDTGSADPDSRRRADMRKLAALQLLAALSALALYGLLEFSARISSPLGLFVVSQFLFPALALASGVMGGYQFPLASRIYFTGSAESERSLGTLYALDLIGSCLGAVALAAYLLPVFGFFKTALLIGVVNLGPALLAALSLSERPAPRQA